HAPGAVRERPVGEGIEISRACAGPTSSGGRAGAALTWRPPFSGRAPVEGRPGRGSGLFRDFPWEAARRGTSRPRGQARLTGAFVGSVPRPGDGPLLPFRGGGAALPPEDLERERDGAEGADQ